MKKKLVATMAFTLVFLIALSISGDFAHACSLDEELIELETRPGVKMKFVLIEPVNPVASVILFPGGPGKIDLSGSDDKPVINRMKPVFLVRNRQDFAEKGLMVALVDLPSDCELKKRCPLVKESGKVYLTSSEQVEDITAVISFLKSKHDVPVWLIGTSNGTVSVANLGAHLSDGIDGIVLTSTLTRVLSSKNPYTEQYPNALLSMDIDQIKVPVLIAAHQDDKCGHTPPGDSDKLKAAMVNSKNVKIVYLNGGKKPETKPCQWFSPHGFYGIEDKVADEILSFVKANSI